jgi:predicted phage tail protein
MPSIKSLALAGLWFAALAVAQSSPEPGTESSPQPNLDFQEILNALPAESLHAALHEHLDDKFKDGIYEKDSHAVKAVQNVNPGLAIKLVAAARYDLIRRASNTTTTTAAPPPPTTTTTSTSNTAVIVPVPVTTTDAAGSTTVSTATALVSASVSAVVTLSSTDAAGSVVVVTSTAPAVVLTNSQGQLTTSAAPTLSNGVVRLTTTNAAGSTYVATFTPGGGVVSSVLLLTTTLPDGSRKTSTSFLIVPASKTPHASGTAGPKLQNAAGQLRAVSVLPLVLGSVLLVLGAGVVWL